MRLISHEMRIFLQICMIGILVMMYFNSAVTMNINTSKYQRDQPAMSFISISTTLYGKPTLFQYRKNYGYFVWLKGILSLGENQYHQSGNYNRVCTIIHDIINQPSPLTITADTTPGGLGHKYLSLFHAVTYAILSRRQLFVNLPNTFRQVTSHCLFDNNMSTTANITLKSLHKECLRSNDAIDTLLGNQSVLMTDCRMNNNVFYSYNVINVLMENKILLSSQEMNDYMKMTMRILLNPSRDIQRYIRLFQKNNYLGKKCIVGVQVRTGGCFGNNQEIMEMMSKDEIISLPKFVKATIQSEYCPKPAIFLSTDSDRVENYIRKEMKEYSIYTTNLRRAHSGGKATLESVKGALADLYLLADSDILITNTESGFGIIASTITRAKKRLNYKVTHRLMNNNEYEKCIKNRPYI